MKFIILISMFIGSFIGGYVPTLWGAGLFSFSGVIGNTIGGIVGIYLGYQIGTRFFN